MAEVTAVKSRWIGHCRQSHAAFFFEDEKDAREQQKIHKDYTDHDMDIEEIKGD